MFRSIVVPNSKVNIVVVVSIIIGFVVTILGIIGAKQFNAWLVGIAGLLYAVITIFLVVLAFADTQDLPALFLAVVPAVFVYPHIMFVVENQKGIMTEENYRNVEQSCCCV